MKFTLTHRKKLYGGACSWSDNTGVPQAKYTGMLDSGLPWLVDAAYAVTASRGRWSEALNSDGFGMSASSGHVIQSCKIRNHRPILLSARMKWDLRFTSFWFECEELIFSFFFRHCVI